MLVIDLAILEMALSESQMDAWVGRGDAPIRRPWGSCILRRVACSCATSFSAWLSIVVGGLKLDRAPPFSRYSHIEGGSRHTWSQSAFVRLGLGLGSSVSYLDATLLAASTPILRLSVV